MKYTFLCIKTIVFFSLLFYSFNVYSQLKKNEFIKVEGGEFWMGDAQQDSIGIIIPTHCVKINSFFITKYEISRGEYLKFCNETGRKMPIDVYPEEGDSGFALFRPISNVTWYDAVAYCKWVGGRLPTEAEWEFAARGGVKSKNYLYAGSNNIDSVAWYGKNTRDDKSHPVIHYCGMNMPNELGIYDMTGNVREWCQDWFDQNYYKNSPKKNPKGPLNGKEKVIRGCYFNADEYECMIVNRFKMLPSNFDFVTGFRVVKDEL